MLQSFILATSSKLLLLSAQCLPISHLLMLLAQRHIGAPGLRNFRVQLGQVVAGLKATKRGLLCGRAFGIGDSAAGELLRGLSNIGV